MQAAIKNYPDDEEMLCKIAKQIDLLTIDGEYEYVKREFPQYKKLIKKLKSLCKDRLICLLSDSIHEKESIHYFEAVKALYPPDSLVVYNYEKRIPTIRCLEEDYSLPKNKKFIWSVFKYHCRDIESSRETVSQTYEYGIFKAGTEFNNYGLIKGEMLKQLLNYGDKEDIYELARNIKPENAIGSLYRAKRIFPGEIELHKIIEKKCSEVEKRKCDCKIFK